MAGHLIYRGLETMLLRLKLVGCLKRDLTRLAVNVRVDLKTVTKLTSFRNRSFLFYCLA